MAFQLRPLAAALSRQTADAVPTSAGQDAFGAIQEIIHILEADPETDWSKGNPDALRQHLIDRNDATPRANVVTKPIKSGTEAMVTGRGRTIQAIQRMVTVHVQEIDRPRLNGGTAQASPIGVLARGANPQRHHLAIAKGEFMDMHNSR